MKEFLIRPSLAECLQRNAIAQCTSLWHINTVVIIHYKKSGTILMVIDYGSVVYQCSCPMASLAVSPGKWQQCAIAQLVWVRSCGLRWKGVATLGLVECAALSINPDCSSSPYLRQLLRSFVHKFLTVVLNV